MLSVILATVILDKFILRGAAGSLTTMFPGFVYSAALTMKVCIAEGLVLISLTLIDWATSTSREKRAAIPPKERIDASASTNGDFPKWASLSVVLTPLAPLVGAVAILISQALTSKPPDLSLAYFSALSRAGVLVSLLCLVAGAVSAGMALARREEPQRLSILPAASNAFLICMFWYFEFYKLGFDQDRWTGS
jgi:hypothetical protein